jgi:D-amino-acid dehydrogenase
MAIYAASAADPPAIARPGSVALAGGFLGKCRVENYRRNKAHMLRLAEYSRDILKGLRDREAIEYDQRSLGTLQLFRSQKQLDAIARDLALLSEYGIPHSLLDRDQLSQHEPALATVRERFVGGLHLPGDETGDCLAFTRTLADKAASLGARFEFNSQIHTMKHDGEQIVGVRTSTGVHQADVYLVALASHTPALLAPLGLRLPIYPVKGYSLTVPITQADAAPCSTVMDETFKVAITRLGDRIRIGGTAELNSFNLDLDPRRIDTLRHVLKQVFPHGGDMSRATAWAGLRPMTFDGPPILGPTPYRNLHLATGHGTLGWTMAAGTGKLLADLISGREPEIDMDGLTLARYGRY